jgi:hypothetical protein
MTWLQRWIVDLFNTLAAWYYRRKYGAAARQLGRNPHEAVDGQRRFIIIERTGSAGSSSSRSMAWLTATCDRP